MKPLEPPDSFYLQAAKGWLGLGKSIEADAELKKIKPALHSHPDVLELCWQICDRNWKWEACLHIGSAIVEADPTRRFGWIHRSISLHRLKRTQEAYDQLKPATNLFLDSWLIRYHLACLACQLGRRDDACKWLTESFDLGDEKAIKLMALNAPELEPLWIEIQKG